MQNQAPLWDEEDLAHALGCLRRGGTLLYPTDTIWGLGADAENQRAVEKIFVIKERPLEKSMIILIANTSALDRYLDSPSAELKQRMENTEQPTTFIVPGGKSLPPLLLGPGGTLAIRLTRDPFCLALIEALGRPLVSSSANRSGMPPPGKFPDVDPLIRSRVDYIVRHRQEEDILHRPSPIWRYEGQGRYTQLRS